VMHTQPDGTKRLIQVAPPPVVNEPWSDKRPQHLA
jgi:hypothetical protein